VRRRSPMPAILIEARGPLGGANCSLSRAEGQRHMALDGWYGPASTGV
jgi:hypothetical protein